MKITTRTDEIICWASILLNYVTSEPHIVNEHLRDGLLEQVSHSDWPRRLDLVGSNRVCSLGQTIKSSETRPQQDSLPVWSCPELGPAWPKEQVLNSPSHVDIL